ncbi:MAG: energy-coupling factor transporter ATPase [Methanobacteriaceae archaeon]|nr:energy-coupling factor transporter ATPase [Methanobacteriaceae archaeon]
MVNMVEIENFYYRYPHQTDYCLKDLNLDIKKGEFVFLTGKSGCGKSTLAKCFNGTIPHTIGGEIEGNITVNGKNTRDYKVNEIAADIGFVFQNPESQFFTLKVEDEVAFGPENFALKPEEIQKRINWALKEVEMSEMINENVYNLSEGQKQRIAIAANLSILPEVLVLDEPTSNLDPKGAQRLFNILDKLKDKGKTIILIDHRTQYALKTADKIIIMDEGNIINEFDPEILEDNQIRKKFGIRDPNYKIRNIKNHSNKRKFKVLEIKDLNFVHSNGFKLQDISLDLKEGEVLGIVGNNGSGKTTLASLISGLLKTKNGKIKIYSAQERNNSKKNYKVGMVLQNPDHQLFMDSVYNELAFGLEEMELNPEDIKKQIQSVLDSMNLWQLKDRHPHSLSGGEKQRTLISALMARKPDLLILDEPTTGMDGYHMDKLVLQIKKLSTSSISIILISHDMEFIDKSCDRLLYLEEGRLSTKESFLG